MKLTKDEAMILAVALEEYKFDVVRRLNLDKELSVQAMTVFNNLQSNLEDYSNDQRMNREKTVRSYQDRVRKYVFGVFDSWDIGRKKRSYVRRNLSDYVKADNS